MKTLRELILILRTARYLRLSQAWFWVLRRYLPSASVRLRADVIFDLRMRDLVQPPCSVSGIYVNDYTFRFLNTEVDISDGRDSIDWSARHQTRLWQYNLHYFDYLREHARPADNKDRMIQSWIDGNPQGSAPGWEPFTTSLRIVNWIFYFLQRPAETIPEPWLNSLYLQALWLERNDERHILANHYFENLKALFFAGCFFAGDDAKRWLSRSLKEIPNQAKEQTLDDGGHYERSPLYHCLMLENYLDVYNLSQSRSALLTIDFINQLRSIIVRSLDWLAAVLFPDRMIPLFNDSAFGVSILPKDLFLYAERLFLKVDHGIFEERAVIDRPMSGLYGIRLDKDMFIIDCGDIGPSYQPGHTHCDFLSYELMLSGRRIVVDTGVFEYEPGKMRHYVRSTRAHNTVSIDGDEQSEIWSQFRVARRAQKITANIKMSRDKMVFRGAYRGFYGTRSRVRHQRSVEISLSPDGTQFREIDIKDYLTGSGRHHKVESFIHIHPEIHVQLSRSGRISLVFEKSEIACIQIATDQDYRIESSSYCPEFGKKIPSQVVVLVTNGTLPLSLSYKIQHKISPGPNNNLIR